MLFARIPLLLALLHLASTEQPSAPSPVAAPLRELPWGQLNFLHTTDTHGWHGGHLQEAQYAADWGDYISFAHHLRKRADKDGSDVLLIDTGDRVEGNGLYDASSPKGKFTYDILKQQSIDVVTSGNHELYIRNTSRREYDEMVPDFKNSYIASNLDIHDPNSEDGTLIPFAPRFRKFSTKNQGIRILAFGFMFNFHGNANNTVVQPVEETVKEKWFQDAIREKEVDLFLVAGHVPVRDSKEFDIIYKAIRDANWDTPIVFFGGHTHIRDYRKWEKKAYGIESGRYMETLGFLSISGLNSGGDKKDLVHTAASPDYKRLYIDNNLFSLHHHSKTNKSTFATDLGVNVSKSIHQARSALELDHAFGCAPRDFWLNRAPYPSNSSLLTLLEKRILPDTFSGPNATKSIVLTNSGAMRFDIFQGAFTTDTTFLVSPFTSAFRKIKDVPYESAARVLSILNNEGPIALKDLLSFAIGSDEPGSWGEDKLDELLPPTAPVGKKGFAVKGMVGKRDLASDGQQIPLAGISHENKDKEDGDDNHDDDDDDDDDERLVPGYTTTDDDGSDGDDTRHAAIKFYTVPNCIAANIAFSPSSSSPSSSSSSSSSDDKDKDEDKDPAEVDLIYNEFIQDWILLALRYLGVRYGVENTQSALDGKSMTDVISEWVARNWKCDDDDGDALTAGLSGTVGPAAATASGDSN